MKLIGHFSIAVNPVKMVFITFTMIFGMNCYSQDSEELIHVLVGKDYMDDLQVILNKSEKELLNREVDKGNLYLKITQDNALGLRGNNIEYKVLKCATPSAQYEKHKPEPANRSGNPELDPPYYDGDPYVGSSITIYLTGRNASALWSNDVGYITMTLPDFCTFDSYGGDSDWDVIEDYICGNSIYTCYNTNISAYDVLVDGTEDGWSILEEKTLWATVTPSTTMTLDIYSKMSIGTERDPEGSCQGPDQQSWPVYWHTISITQMPRPDLIVEDIWTVPSTPCVNQSTNLWARIKNIGNGTASSLTWRYKIDNVQVGTDTHSELAPGATREESFDGYVFTSTGNHSYKVEVDPVTNEIVTSNNSRTETVNVSSCNTTPNAPSFYGTPTSSLYPTKSYSIQVDYTDNDGADNLQIVYLRLAQGDNESTNRATMLWYLTGGVSQFADEPQVLTNMSATKTSITNGYRVTWNFTLLWNWVESTNVDYWAFSMDDANAESTHTKQNQNALHENDIRIYSSTENADPVTAGDNYSVEGLVTFEGTSTAPDNWTGISVEMRQSTVGGTLLNTDNTVSSGYSVTWGTDADDVGTHNIYIVPKNTNHQPPNNSDTYWDLENVTVLPDLILTRITDNSFSDMTVRLGETIEFNANLQYYQYLIWWNLSNEIVHYDIDANQNNIFESNEEYGFSTTINGIAQWFFTANYTELDPGNYSIRARYNGSSTYSSCNSVIKTLTIIKPNWIIFYYLCHGNDLESHCNAKFQSIAQEAANQNFVAITLWDHLADNDEDRVYKMTTETNWQNYLHNIDYWNGSDVPGLTQEFDMGTPATLTSFIDWAVNTIGFEANNYALVMFNHGSGVIRSETPLGICYDGTSFLTIDELGNATSLIYNDLGEKLSIMHMDACLMQMIEINYEMADYVDCVVSSENEGWANPVTSFYDEYLELITANISPINLSIEISEAYDNYCNNASLGHTISSLYLTGSIDNIINNLDIFCLSLIDNCYLIKNEIATSRIQSQKFDRNGDGSPRSNLIIENNDDYVDLKHFVQCILNNISLTDVVNSANNLLTSIGNEGGNFIKFENHLTGSGFSLDNSQGLSIYFPDIETSEDYLSYINDQSSDEPFNLDLVTMTSWDEFLIRYFDFDPPICSIIMPNNGGWFRGNISCMAAADDLVSDVVYVEFQYSLNNSDWYPLPGPDSPDGKDWYGENGWILTFQTTNTPVHGTINDNSVWIQALALDGSGNSSTWDLCNTPFGVDNSSPMGTIVINNGATTTTTNIVTLTLTYSDNLSGVTQMKFSNNGTTWSDWQTASASTNWDLFSYGGNTSYGMKTVYAKFKDAAQNESNTYTDQIEYIIPAPVLGSLAINNGAATTSSTQVTLNNSAINSPTHYMASEYSNFSGASWLTYSTGPYFTLSSGYGMKTVYLKVKNSTGESNVLSDNIEYVQTLQPPAISYFAINNGAAATGSVTVTLNNTATNSPTHYMASENSNFSGASWLTYSAAPSFTLSSGYGIKTVYFKVKNTAGTSGPASDQIEYVDNTVPANIAVQNVTIGNGNAECYDATQIITVAGGGTTFAVQSGGDATFIAGQKIRFLPGTNVSLGGHLHGFITTSGNYCGSMESAIVSNPPPDTTAFKPEPELPGSGFKIYPNPTTGTFTLLLDEPVGEIPCYFQVIGMIGNVILNERLEGSDKFEFDLTAQNRGMFVFRLIRGGNVETGKIIKN